MAFSIDPVCVFHGEPMSEHSCLYCCICFKTLTFEECNRRPDGKREDVCVECAAMERNDASTKEVRPLGDQEVP